MGFVNAGVSAEIESSSKYVQSKALDTQTIPMAGSSRTTFTKRQKERARQEKRVEKAQRKAERKQSGDSQTSGADTQSVADLVVTHDEEGQPQGFDFHDFAK